MVDCKDIKICSLELLKIIKSDRDVKIVEEQKIIKLLCVYIDKLIFNIIALSCILCLKIGIEKIMNEHVKFLLDYINKYCKISKKSKQISMSGGVFNTAQFFGIDETNRYNVQNEGKDILNCDFNNNIARPEIGLITGGGDRLCNKLNKIIKYKVKNVFKHFNIKIQNSALEQILDKFTEILIDMTDKIKNKKGNILNLEDVKKILYKGNIMKK